MTGVEKSVLESRAEALVAENRLEESLPLFEQAIAQAEREGQKAEAGALAMRLGPLLFQMGRPDTARDTFLRAWHLLEAAGRPRWESLGAELEVLRLDLASGKIDELLPRLEEILLRVREMRRALQETSEDSLRGVARALDTALGLLVQAYLQQERWQDCLDRLSEAEVLNRKMGATELEIAILRYNRIRPLFQLQRLDEAEIMLEECLLIFREEQMLSFVGGCLSALSSLAESRQDLDKALAFETEALQVRDGLDDIDDRGVSHSNMANTLNRLGRTPESRQHRVASLVYGLLSHNPQIITLRIRNLSVDYKLAREAKMGFDLPRIAEMVQSGPFAALARELELRKAPIDKLQGRVDAMITQVRAWSRVRPMF